MKTNTLTVLLCSVVLVLSATAQDAPLTGYPQFNTLVDEPTGNINLGNLNIHVQIPIFNKTGKGLNFASYLEHDFGALLPRTNKYTGNTSFRVYYTDFSLLTSMGALQFSLPTFTCADRTNQTQLTGFFFIDANNTTHSFSGAMTTCTEGPKSFTATSQDGWTISASLDTQNYLSATVTDPGGVTYYTDHTSQQTFCVGAYGCLRPTLRQQDPNGNVVSVTNTYNTSTYTNTGTYTDSVGYTPLSYVFQGWPHNSSTSSTFTYPNPAGGNETIQINYSALTINTAFNCPGILDVTGSGTSYLPTSISLPDGSAYSIVYESTSGSYPSTIVTGRIHSLQLPTGGTITYTYSGGTNGITCLDGGPATLTKQTPDGTWTYTRSYGSTTKLWTTVVSDPVGNTTTYTFSSLNTTGDPFQFEVNRAVSGTSGSLGQILTCYNGNTSSCATVNTITTPITKIDRYTYLTGQANPKLSEQSFSMGLLTQDKEYDFGTFPSGGALISNRTISYGNYVTGTGCVALSGNIVNRPCVDQIFDGSGTSQAGTQFSYDPQGNETSAKYLDTAVALSRSWSYFPNGLVQTATDINGQGTSYTYGNCNGSYPTQINAPLSMSTSLAWDCNGGVVTSSIDANGQTTTYGYVNINNPSLGDPFWRTMYVTAPYSGTTTTTTSYTYTATSVESLLNFASSTVDALTTADSLGRVKTRQKRQAPGSSNFDTTSYTFDGDGRLATVSSPCVATAGASCSSSVGSFYSYDGLNRVTQISNSGGGYTSFTYTGQDVLQTLGPAPAGENLKKRQYEYDGAGRLKSVCEILASGGTTCSQASTGFGYKTSYTYSTPAGGGTQLAVNQGAQTRTFVKDGLGRLISESNPESGTTTYTYDTIGASYCAVNYAYTSNGDLVAKGDANGNHLCYWYDALHRLTDVGNNNQSATNYIRRFRYDSPLNGFVPAPSGSTFGAPVGRLIEAYTGFGTQITDEWFNYSPRGEVADVYEETINSGGYYHTTASYFSNGALQSLGGVPGYGIISYGVDGEGRLSSAQQGTTKLVCDGSCSSSSTSYNAASQPQSIHIGGTSDNDAYSYDSNTGLMTGFTFTVGSTPKSIGGTLTWNQNGSLRSLALADSFNSGGAQICNFGTSSPPVAGYDDLGRLLSANCGSVWSQTFSYDQYGNLTKSGSLAWNPGYYASSNHYMLAGTSYDSDGNLLTDPFHSYTWSMHGYPGMIDTSTCATGVCATYDANGQMVEKNVSGVYSQVLYSPVGKLAIMNGQTAILARFPMPGGATYYQAGSTGADKHFWHKDWLGNVRLSTTLSSRASIFDRAFAPFGETYNNFGNTTNNNFTGDTQDTVTGTYDTPNRFLNPNQGRWISPDPAGLGVATLKNPQSWNRYAYVLNNPLGLLDPTGLDCAYLNDAGTDLDKNGLDQESNAGECGSNGGYWVDGSLVNYAIDAEQGAVQLWGTTQAGLDVGGNTYASYQDTTFTAGWFMNHMNLLGFQFNPNPLGHIAIGVGRNPQVGLNPRSDMGFLGSLAANLFACVGIAGCDALANTVVPGAILPEDPGVAPLQSVTIPITGMQANMMQSAIDASTLNPPNYSVGGPLPACDCGIWAQQVMLVGGLQSGPPAPVPAVFIEQLNNLYP